MGKPVFVLEGKSPEIVLVPLRLVQDNNGDFNIVARIGAADHKIVGLREVNGALAVVRWLHSSESVIHGYVQTDRCGRTKDLFQV